MAAVVLVSVAGCLLLQPTVARAAGPGAVSLVNELASSTPTLDQELQTANQLAALSPASAFDAARAAMQAGAAGDRFRTSVRQEQLAIYQLAGDPTLATQVESDLGSRAPAGLTAVLSALQALFALTGATDPTPEFVRPYNAADAVPTLEGFYQGGAAAAGIDWEYLAAINFIESDFGRNTDTSSAGAEGPMQFLPSTWALYGEGGNIDDPQDAIDTAARYLAAMGAPGDYPLAIQRYNDDSNYVAAVIDLASAIATDPLWLQRLYYWGTYG